jgi:cytochrome c oxidase subunit 4
MADQDKDKIDRMDERHQSTEPHPHETVRTYNIVFACLMALLVLTVIASVIPFDRMLPGLNAIVALTIAVAKGLLVILFFMHVKRANKLTWAFASAAFVWVGIMFVLTFGDYFTRRAVPTIAPTEPRYYRAESLEHVNRGADQPVSDRGD